MKKLPVIQSYSCSHCPGNRSTRVCTHLRESGVCKA
jgi:hypothetical protein